MSVPTFRDTAGTYIVGLLRKKGILILIKSTSVKMFTVCFSLAEGRRPYWTGFRISENYNPGCRSHSIRTAKRGPVPTLILYTERNECSINYK